MIRSRSDAQLLDRIDQRLLDAYRSAWRACAGHMKVTVEDDYPPWTDEGGLRTLRRPEPGSIRSRVLRVTSRAGSRRPGFHHQYIYLDDSPEHFIGVKLSCTRLFLAIAQEANAHLDRCVAVAS